MDKPTLCVIGLGKLGRPMMEVFQEKGFEVVGIDKGDDYSQVKDVDIIFVVVPTPSNEDGSFSDRYIREVLDEIKPYIKNQLVVITSTVSPGTMDKLLKKYGYRLVYNPEFIALGSVKKDLLNPDLVLIGSGGIPFKPSDLLDVYDHFCENNPPKYIMTFLEAEIAKISLNCYLTMKISYANTLGELCEKAGADVDRITDVIGADSRIGRKFLKAGLGYGGPCLPRDNKAFQAYAYKVGVFPVLSEDVDYVNDYQIQRVLDKVGDVKKVYVSSLSYKEGTNITEGSQAYEIAEILKDNGIEVLDTPEGADISIITHNAPTEKPKGKVIDIWRRYKEVKS